MAAKKKAARRPARDEGAAVLSLDWARKKADLSGRFEDLSERLHASLETYEMLVGVMVELGFDTAYAKLAARDLLEDWLNGKAVPTWQSR
jgi:hypothetical protein